ncbi:Fic family protein [Acetobacter persici]|uniref:Fic family protein n=1 Tax=Acetobacter persici TaxID=1076596 RepID=UPI001FCBEC94|nr:Fic family protein [Acetobacter persici]
MSNEGMLKNMTESRLQKTQRMRMARALEELGSLQSADRRIFKSSELSEAGRKLLISQGFLTPVIRGWLMATDPAARPGDSTPWYAGFWEFCAAYSNERFEREWYLTAEQSILIHAENRSVPRQVVILSPRGQNNNIKLPFGTAIFDSNVRNDGLSRDEIEVREGLNVQTLPSALIRIPQSFFVERPIDAEVALRSLRDTSLLLSGILNGAHASAAGRLAGGLRHIGRPDEADRIIATTSRAGMSVSELNPFMTTGSSVPLHGYTPPIVGRIQALWEKSREQVINAFPPAPGLPADKASYLAAVEDSYLLDAYNSLSIEGYRVTPELIERVRSGNWNPDASASDRDAENALAARGYYLAFERAKDIVSNILDGGSPGAAMRRGHIDWYQDLFAPKVQAGLLQPSSLAGYRNHFIYLRTSRYVPPHKDQVPEGMSALLDLLEQEPEASVRATLGHWLLGYIHPFPDGNGRTARFLMNAMLASGGYPWTVIKVEDRDSYLSALDSASLRGDIAPFAEFVGERVRDGMNCAPEPEYDPPEQDVSP